MREYVNKLQVLVGPIHMVMSDKVAQVVREKKRRYDYLPEPEMLLAELQAMDQREGIPTRLNKRRDGTEQLLLYTSSYFLSLYESPRRDGYTIGHVDSLNLQEHEQLSKGALRIKTQGLYLHQELREIPPGNRNFWDVISSAWQHFQRQMGLPGEEHEEFSHAHEHYLSVLEDLIEVTHKLEQDKNSLNAGLAYRKVEAAAEVRDAPRDIYVFRLVDFPQLNEKSMLRVKDAPDLRGRVLSVEGLKLTLKFETLIDRKRIPEPGVLEPMASPLIYQKQRDAIKMLRSGEAKNTSLLPVLVDHKYQPYQLDRIVQESDEDLKELTPDEQFPAFQRALTVPDVMMILGPPGTGKTRTITEIARYCGDRKRRVLISSGTHKAVDNVLERMPEDLIVVRVGHESNVSEKMRPKMIDAQARKLQEVILERTEPMAYALGRLHSSKDEIDALVRLLEQGQTYLVNKEAQLQPLYRQRDAANLRVTRSYRQRYDELNATLQPVSEKISRLYVRNDAWNRRRASSEARRSMPVLGWLFMLVLNFSLSRLQRIQQNLQEKLQKRQAAQEGMRQQQEEGQRALLADGEYQQCERTIRQLTIACENVWTEVLKTAGQLQTRTRGAMPEQPELVSKGAATLQRYLSWFKTTRQTLERKADLLKDWRGELAQPTDQLYPELMRYADVVGATCIGAATAKGMEAIEFDLAIVDEAGQIFLADLLVPLVRAKRAVLVGDPYQLPPFVDSEVHTWFKESFPHVQSLTDIAGDEERLIADLLTKSAFEQLFAFRPDSLHFVQFTKQGRMPRVIADFASSHFYANQLGTFDDKKMRHTIDADPLFRYPLALIDTSDAPENIKWERQQRTLDSLGEKGYTNVAEARVIADLAEVYERGKREWVVIVPYRAQARLIIDELARRIEAHDFSLEERVATVDSFQGGERCKVIYGFTRSNEHGKIGFLKEVRRLNVAMTRAQQQLVLVGNFSSLTRADDARFRSLVQNLYTYTGQHGERLTYAEARNRLRGVSEGRFVR